MVEDHRPEVEKIMLKFYANLHQRHGNSFLIWVKGKVIEVTPSLTNKIMGAPHVRDPVYPWLVDHLPSHDVLVECFVEGRPHQIEIVGEGSF